MVTAGGGRALIAAVYDALRAPGPVKTNATAQRLYDRVAERSGFVAYRYDPRGISDCGQP